MINKNDASQDKKKTTYHHGDLAGALVLAGREILNKNGADKLSLRGVAARVGVSQAAPYSHFSDKKDLLRAISASGFRELAAEMETCRVVGRKPEDQILEYGIAYIEYALANPNIYELMFSAKEQRYVSRNANQDPEDTMTLEAKKAYGFLLSEYETMGAINGQALALGAWSMVHGLAALIGNGLVELPENGRREALCNILISQARIPVEGVQNSAGRG